MLACYVMKFEIQPRRGPVHPVLLIDYHAQKSNIRSFRVHLTLRQYGEQRFQVLLRGRGFPRDQEGVVAVWNGEND